MIVVDLMFVKTKTITKKDRGEGNGGKMTFSFFVSFSFLFISETFWACEKVYFLSGGCCRSC